MVAVFYGVGRVLDRAYVQGAIAVIGGAFLLWMSVGMFRKLRAGDVEGSYGHRSPVGAGILLSLSNPYFLVWWATVGATLVMRSVQFGVMGFLALAVVHWSCDFAWSYFLSALSYKGGQFLGRGFQRGVFVTCGVLLAFFSGKLIYDGAVMILA
jgi:threonine/homoserine/homoserine lactone efflux protein